jgi:hypothetical protein
VPVQKALLMSGGRSIRKFFKLHASGNITKPCILHNRPKKTKKPQTIKVANAHIFTGKSKKPILRTKLLFEAKTDYDRPSMLIKVQIFSPTKDNHH